MLEARAFWVTAPGHGEIRTQWLRPPASGELLIRTFRSAVSRGTERLVTLAANMETAINGMWDARPCPGDRIAVIGAGVVGCLVAALAARLPGTEVELIDIDPARGAIARAVGCNFATPETASPEAD